MCGHIYDDAKEKVKFLDLPNGWVCPACGAPKSLFEVVETELKVGKSAISDDNDYIKHLAATGESIVSVGPTEKKLPSWDEILLLAGQLASVPLHDDEAVDTKTVIGKKAKRPLVIDTPVIISHMSYGALTGEAKVALAKGAAAIGSANGSGEGGIYGAEMAAAGKYIFEYVPNLYSVTDENLRAADAVEIKIGQSAKPGLGGHLPAEKVTEEIAKMRGFPVGRDIISPSHFDRLKTRDDLKELVGELREKSGGRPIGVKIAANHIEDDLEFIAYAGADFVTVDGRGGSTGAAPISLKNATGVPTIYALARARKWLDEHKMELDLIITGGLRLPSDMAKALAMGADVVAIATAALVAMSADVELSADEKLTNFLRATTEEMKMFARVAGRRSVGELCIDDLVTTSLNIATYTDVKHV
jgi:glutamate synthase domain-containing protein 2/rubredoxin